MKTIRHLFVTFVIVAVTLVVMYVALHRTGGRFSIAAPELVRQLATAAAIAIVLQLVAGRRR